MTSCLFDELIVGKCGGMAVETSSQTRLRRRTPWEARWDVKKNWQPCTSATRTPLGGTVGWRKKPGSQTWLRRRTPWDARWDGERKMAGIDGCDGGHLGRRVGWRKERAAKDGCGENKTTRVADFGGDTQMMIIDYYVNKIAFCRRQIWEHIVKRRRFFTTSSCFFGIILLYLNHGVIICIFAREVTGVSGS